MEAFFQQTRAARDPLYRDISRAANSHLLEARSSIENMWEACDKFLDHDALERATNDDFYAVWWELYLAYALKEAGVRLVARRGRAREKKGPDLLGENPRVWIEAIMPKPGDGADGLREPPMGEVFSVPADAFVLRLCGAIQEKMHKYMSYIDAGLILPGEATIIAVSGARLPFHFSEQPIPSIVRALFGVGHLVLEINLGTKKSTGISVEYRDHVVKQSKPYRPICFCKRNPHMLAPCFTVHRIA